MKFAHLADCHIGGWREPKLKELSIKVFEKAVEECIKEHVGFVLISGDLFDSALPSIDILKETVSVLNKLKEEDIPVYVIPGSHDFSVSGKTMLDVLENAGLLENVVKFEDEKLIFTLDRTGTKITGLLGKKGGLEREDYIKLNREGLEREGGFKIFMFHTALEEFKPKDFEKVECMSYSLLPKNFDYYAGGHVHYVFDRDKEGYGKIVFPGALFPNNFKEIEQFKHGGFYIVDVNNGIDLRYKDVRIIDTLSFIINVNDKKPDEVREEILNRVKDYDNKILTLRVEGVLKSGKPSDIDFNDLLKRFEKAFVVLKNTSKLSSPFVEDVEVDEGNIEEIERRILDEFKTKMDLDVMLVDRLIESLDKEKEEGEKNFDFEKRLIKDAFTVLGF